MLTLVRPWGPQHLPQDIDFAGSDHLVTNGNDKDENIDNVKVWRKLFVVVIVTQVFISINGDIQDHPANEGGMWFPNSQDSSSIP